MSTYPKNKYTPRARSFRCNSSAPSQALPFASSKPYQSPLQPGARAAVPATHGKVVVSGDPDFWLLVQKGFDPASKWTKTTRAANVPGGILVNTCSRKRGGGEAVAEAIVFVPGCRVTAEGKIVSL
ncbi:hypothetical protein [Nibricoccus sp. IMCC34717]|uniref:hypothetical protein n=1 Tax=Nibricoccus sp. IMCC34717 TaxID=3034021 RepID=UPI003851387A